MASIPITSWQIDEEKVKTVTNSVSLGSKITVDGDCSHRIRRRLLCRRKAMTNLDRVLKSRDSLEMHVCNTSVLFAPRNRVLNSDLRFNISQACLPLSQPPGKYFCITKNEFSTFHSNWSLPDKSGQKFTKRPWRSLSKENFLKNENEEKQFATLFGDWQVM